MIIANEKTDVSLNGVGKVAQATIKASARLFSFFSDQIYADKYVAIWRELVANGVDAQVVAKTRDIPVVVTLPTDYTPYAKVRDFGTGMSELFLVGDEAQGIPSKFMAYTDASTKENTNDLIGGFGIGSKAPLSYTEQFAIKSYQGGIVKVYSVFKDETGCPAIAKLAESATDEPDGVEISFPVEGKDIKGFRDAVPNTLKYFNPQPKIINGEALTPIEYTVKTPTWGFVKGSATSRVVQGGIAYPIDKGSVKEIDDMLDFGIDFFVPIGACSIALSRERLAYDDRTIRVLKSLVDTIKPDLEAHVTKMFANCKTLWEAETLYWNECRQPGARGRLVAAHGYWNGQKLKSRIVVPADLRAKFQTAFVTDNRYDRTNYQNWTEGKTNPTVRAWLMDIYPKDIGMILVDDKPLKPVLRARRYLEENNLRDKGVMIIRPAGDDTSVKDFVKLRNLLGNPPFMKLSQIEPAVVVRSFSSGPRAQVVRAYKSGTFDPPRRNYKFVDTLPDSGYYMRMDNFSVVGGQATIEQLRASGLKAEDIFWFNKSDFEVIKDNPKWKPALVKYEATLAEYAKTHKNMGLASAIRHVLNEIYSYNGNKAGYWFQVAGMIEVKSGPLYQLRKLYNLVSAEQSNGSDVAMRKLLNVDMTKELSMVRGLCSAAVDKYPELWTLLTHGNSGPSASLVSVYRKLV